MQILKDINKSKEYRDFYFLDETLLFKIDELQYSVLESSLLISGSVYERDFSEDSLCKLQFTIPYEIIYNKVSVYENCSDTNSNRILALNKMTIKNEAKLLPPPIIASINEKASELIKTNITEILKNGYDN